MIKKYRYLLIFILLFSSKGNTLSPLYEKELFKECYSYRKTFIGSIKAKIICNCTIEKLSEKYTDNQINEIFQKKPDSLESDIGFTAIECDGISLFEGKDTITKN